jgi:hypothetical protein
MITLKTRMLRGVALSLATLALVSVAHAQDMNRFRRDRQQRRPVTFDVSGTFTGALDGQVLIDGAAYRYDESLQVYQLGVGLVSIGDVAVGSRVYASGMGSADAGTLRVVIARPADEGVVDVNASSKRIRERDASSPR